MDVRGALRKTMAAMGWVLIALVWPTEAQATGLYYFGPFDVDVGATGSFVYQLKCHDANGNAFNGQVALTEGLVFEKYPTNAEVGSPMAYNTPQSQYVTTAGGNFTYTIQSKGTDTVGQYYQDDLGICNNDINDANTLRYQFNIRPVIDPATSQHVAWNMWQTNPLPPNYGPATLTALPAGAGSYTWKLDSNNCLVFDNGTTSETTTTNTVQVVAKCNFGTLNGAPITYAATVTVNGISSANWLVQVRSPGSVSLLSKVNVSNPSGSIWETDLHYVVVDNYGSYLPNPIPMNESYTSPQPVTYDYPGGSFWPSIYANGGHDGPTILTSAFVDTLSVYAMVPSLLNPIPTPIQSPPSTTLVFHFPGTYSFGSAKQGQGVCVASLTWNYYVDHGDHTYLKGCAS